MLDIFKPEDHSRRNRRLIVERLFSAITPKDRTGNTLKNIRVLPSGAGYRVDTKGTWHRINHPQNKRDRRIAQAERETTAEMEKRAKGGGK